MCNVNDSLNWPLVFWVVGVPTIILLVCVGVAWCMNNMFEQKPY